MTIEQKLAALDAKIASARQQRQALKIRQDQLEARKLSRLLKGHRAADTRRKILVGAMVLAEMERSQDIRSEMTAELDRYLSRDDDRALFDLPPRGPQA